MMIALKITADMMALNGDAKFMMFSGAIAG